MSDYSVKHEPGDRARNGLPWKVVDERGQVLAECVNSFVAAATRNALRDEDSRSEARRAAVRSGYSEISTESNMSMGEVLSTLTVNMLRSDVDWESEPVLVLLAASICGHDRFLERAHELGFGRIAERARDAMRRSVQPVTVFQCSHVAPVQIDTGTGSSDVDAREGE